MRLNKYRELLEGIAQASNGKTIESYNQGKAKTAMQLLDPDYHKLQVAKVLAKVDVENDRDVRDGKKSAYKQSLLDKASVISSLSSKEVESIKASKQVLANEAKQDESTDESTEIAPNELMNVSAPIIEDLS